MNEITIGFGGDLMIGRLVNRQLNESDPEYIWGNLLPVLHKTDLNIVNLEAALTQSTTMLPKMFNFRAEPRHVKTLQVGSIDLVNLANNHILDYEVQGLLETLATLDRSGIQHVGAGRTLAEAKQPAILQARGIYIGVLGYTDNEPGWEATKNSPGTRYIEIGDLDTVLEDMHDVRDLVDILVVSLHWGPNMRERPPESFVRFAHQLIDHGVDIVHGHSAHIFQGVESYRHGLIFYDTGELIDDYMVDPILRNDLSFFFLATVTEEGCSGVRMVPLVIDNCQVNIATGRDREEATERMRRLSKELGTEVSTDLEVLCKPAPR